MSKKIVTATLPDGSKFELTPDLLKQMTFSFGKPLTEEEFQELKRKNPSVTSVKAPNVPRKKDAETRVEDANFQDKAS